VETVGLLAAVVAAAGPAQILAVTAVPVFQTVLSIVTKGLLGTEDRAVRAVEVAAVLRSEERAVVLAA
jgi:hypothetical protein